MQFKVTSSFILATLAFISGSNAARPGLSRSTAANYPSLNPAPAANYPGLPAPPASYAGLLQPPAAPVGQCNTGSLQCCQSVQSTNSHPAVSPLLGILGIVVQSVDAMIGLSCSPLNIIGAAGNSCSAQPVCCENNQFNGLVSVGCTPANVNL